jgi:hypothetical protein
MGDLRYLAFCGNCGHHREIEKHIIQLYWVHDCTGFYCNYCKTPNEIPAHLKKITKELAE